MTSARDGLPRSVQVRLARHAKEIGVDANLVLTRYAVERFLYRCRARLTPNERWNSILLPKIGRARPSAVFGLSRGDYRTAIMRERVTMLLHYPVPEPFILGTYLKR